MIIRAATYIAPGPRDWMPRLFEGVRITVCGGCGALVAMRFYIVFTGCRCGSCGAELRLAAVWDEAPKLVQAVQLSPPAPGARLDDEEACPGAPLSRYRRGTCTPQP